MERISKRSRQPLLPIIAPVLLAIFLTACQPPLVSKRRPYVLSQGLLGNFQNSPPRRRDRSKHKHLRAHRKKRRRTLRAATRTTLRCARRLIGARFSGPRAQALRAFLGRCLPPRARDGALRSSDPPFLRRRPRAGDLVFFTPNHLGKVKPQRTLPTTTTVGIVLTVAGHRVSFVYLSGHRARPGVLDLRRRFRRRHSGTIINSFVRVKHLGDPPGSRYLAGALLSGFRSPG
ncbi:MAG: hypothetical protein KAI47_03615 [Deltaproteobacteria bacterium]|nr:hypothetical protein [Deltaproteobacteria bacterium]